MTVNVSAVVPIIALWVAVMMPNRVWSDPNSLELIRKIPHSGYSEGLDYSDGFLWNALPKEIRKIDPKDGSVVATFSPGSAYSESLVWFQGGLWNVSFSDNHIYKGTLTKSKLNFEKKGDVPEEHAWGITHNGKELIVTGNYSKKLYFLDPKTLKVVRKLEVGVKDIEDLAWDGKRIWSSSFTDHKGKVFSMNPTTGTVQAFYTLPEPDKCPVIDGIAFDGKALWITGKECPSIWLVKLPN